MLSSSQLSSQLRFVLSFLSPESVCTAKYGWHLLTHDALGGGQHSSLRAPGLSTVPTLLHRVNREDPTWGLWGRVWLVLMSTGQLDPAMWICYIHRDKRGRRGGMRITNSNHLLYLFLNQRFLNVWCCNADSCTSAIFLQMLTRERSPWDYRWFDVYSLVSLWIWNKARKTPSSFTFL